MNATGSAGFNGNHLVRARLFFALTHLVSDEQCRSWGKTWNLQRGSKIIDTAIYTLVALHYIARPVLGPGVTDPIGRRWTLHPSATGQERATLDLPPAEAVGTIPQRSATPASAAGGTGAAGFEFWVSQIGSAEHGFWDPINRALGAAAAAGVDEATAVRAVQGAVVAADPGHRSREVIKRYRDAAFLGREFRALAKRDLSQRAAITAARARIFLPPPTETEKEPTA